MMRPKILDSAYWRQRATPWVSAAVLLGGLTSTLILFVVVKFESEVHLVSFSSVLEELMR